MPLVYDPEEHLQVSTAVRNGSHVQRGIEDADALEDGAAKGHVRPGTVLARTEVQQRWLSTLHIPPPVLAVVAAAEAPPPLEQYLRPGLELVGRDQTGNGHDLGVFESPGERPGPPGIDHDVVIRIGDDVAARLGDGPVAGPIEPRPGFANVAHPGVRLAYQAARRVAGGRVVHDQNVQARVIEPEQGLDTQPQVLVAVPRAHGDRYKGRAPATVRGGHVRWLFASPTGRDRASDRGLQPALEYLPGELPADDRFQLRRGEASGQGHLYMRTSTCPIGVPWRRTNT